MAPEPGVLKRVRSKPAEWWAAAPTVTTPPAARQSLPPKKPERALDAGDRAINKGKPVKRKGKEDGEDEENRDSEPGKAVRKGRSSVGEKELRDTGADAENNKKRNQAVASKKLLREGGEIDEPSKATKRRKPHAAAQEEDDDGRDVLAEDPVVTRKRGPRTSQSSTREGQAVSRKGKQHVPKPSEVSQPPTSESAPTRRGRSSNTEAELRAVNYKETATRKQGHLNAGSQAHAVKETATKKQSLPNTETGSSSAIVKKSMAKIDGQPRRGRSSNTEAELHAQVNYKEAKTLKRAALPDAEAGLQSSGTTASRSASGHGKNKQKSASNTEVESSQSVETAKNSRRQQSRRDSEVQTASSKFSKNRSKSTVSVRPTAETKGAAKRAISTRKQVEKPKQGRDDTTVIAAQKASSQRAKKSSKSSEGQHMQKKRKSLDDSASEPPAPKRRRSDRAQDEVQPEKTPNYQHLAAVTRKVSRATIESKWDTLPPSCVDRVSQLLQDIQRPVVVRLSDEQKRNQASSALQMISRRLVNKISRGLPFPLSTRSNREDDFDFEKILDQNRALESQLTPALHANALLEAELAKEQALLEAEQTYLDELESNAKAESIKRKQDARKLHTLLQPTQSTDTEDLEDGLGFQSREPIKPVTFNLLQDENLQAVVQDLQGHVDSIEGNLKQVEGITEAMAKSKAAVQATLFGRLDSARYEDVVLG